jgi:hypothetical protein
MRYPDDFPRAGALFPGQRFPRWMYHATKAAKTVSSAQEEADLGPEWSRVYIHQEYPKTKYHWNGKAITIKNSDEEAALGGGWANTPAAFDAYKSARQARTEEQDPTKWLDEWSVPGLSSEHRKKIKAQLLRADGVFERSLDPDSAVLASMRQAFDGIARVLFEAGILTEELLRKDVSQLVWDSAIAGGWWRLASETRQDIFPEQLGRYWVWRDDSRDWKGLFRAEAAEWEATLLEARSPEMPAAPASMSTDHPEPQAFSQLAASPPDKGNLPATVASVSTEAASSAPSDECPDFTSAAQRIDAVAAYTKSWQCSAAALARTARVDPGDLSKWKKDLLPVESDKKARIEKTLKSNEAPSPTAKRSRNS